MYMDMRRGHQPHHARLQRLGKKAIFYGRIATALGVNYAAAPVKKPTKVAVAYAKAKAYRPTRKHMLATTCAVVLVIAGVFGNSVYQAQRVAAEKAAAKAAYEKQAKINAAAQECYKQKTAQKRQMLGKVTFDQLYDGDSCTPTN